ncbi:sigma-54-dependent transcriptional regulator [Desulfobaculum bizertense]|uniref:Two-component system, NtrC family, response regulator n=1 Tax=Desulfobaculum bizertense DSM 18034 TaxID=1121442 RepID=A0A1T4VFA5_9BACT|nr:sigma-54 dependent transcriptional regulator [Desulfobaculum bizertense]UIJ37707.1 sigma-54 dependent transcriptional regulator [Desulfobaculum bizertense]SKA63563.1 two-component system, NtrC family, response regulator [Desulfobaculum bizertense DSM 18034]
MRESTDTPRVLVVDDEPALRLLVGAVLRDAGWHVMEADSAERALELLPDAGPDAILLDMRMPGMDGLEALGAIRTAIPGVPVVMLTAYGTVGSAVDAMKKGAFDYLTKPADNEELKAVMNKAYDYSRLVAENRELRREAGESSGFIGQTSQMEQVRDLIAQAGPTEATVLVMGESGTGKELVTSALHGASVRAKGPLIKVNCAALPADLLESELFGYVKGAFTGANRDKPGRFQLASGGTLFLDEIGEMPLELQAKLLRALQEKMVEPLGSVGPVPVDVRIIAATNRDLRREVAEGRFREDLYFRLNVLEIRIPSLRERMDDLPLLVAHLLEKLGRKNRKKMREVSPQFLEALQGYPWPGNVRELENALERALVLSRTDSLSPADLPPQVIAGKAHTEEKNTVEMMTYGVLPARHEMSAMCNRTGPSSLDEAEKQALIEALGVHGGHRQKTADALGISRRTLQYKLRKYGLTRRS